MTSRISIFWLGRAAPFVALLQIVCVLGIACRDRHAPNATDEFESFPATLQIKNWHSVEGFHDSIAQFETVFWEPDDTTYLRQMIDRQRVAEDLRVLEIGTGTGLLAIACLLSGAKHVVATDINPAAVSNARYNAELFSIAEALDVRLVSARSSGAFSVVRSDERFDLIISNPPWEDGKVERVDQYAIYDPGMALCDSLLSQGAAHLAPNGKMLLAYGSKAAIERICDSAPRLGWTITMVDNRILDDLPELFVPAVVLELKSVRSP